MKEFVAMKAQPSAVSSRRTPVHACPACGGTARTPWLDAMDYSLVRCGICGHRYAAEMLAAECLADIYYAEADDDLADRSPRAKQARFVEYQAMLDHQGCLPGRVLDVGCNAGDLLALFSDTGWEVAGVEVSRGPAEYARARLGVPIWIGPVEESLPNEERFDLITMTHVLEHLVSPGIVLARLRAALREGGCLLVEVPNADDVQLALWRGFYRPLCPGDHVSFFDAHSLRAVLESAGFSVTETRSPTHARDIVYPSLLSALDWGRSLRRRKASASGVASGGGGVLDQVRYRGRFRAPLRAAMDRFVEAVDPVVVAATAALDRARTGPVLVMLARA